MSNSFNSCQFIGNLTRDVEMKFTPSGSPVSTFSIAVNRRYKTNDGEQKDEATFINIVDWNKSAEMCNQYLAKGSRVFVQGRLSNRSWDGQDGQKHYKTEIIAEKVIFLDKKQNNKVGGEVMPEESEGDITPQDLPF